MRPMRLALTPAKGYVYRADRRANPGQARSVMNYSTDFKSLKGKVSDEEWQAFGGILGHYHISESKVDPGPAIDWEPFLAAVRARRAELELEP